MHDIHLGGIDESGHNQSLYSLCRNKLPSVRKGYNDKSLTKDFVS